MKDYLIGRSLVGTIVGTVEAGGLIPYDDPRLQFYAIVDHESSDNCLPFADVLDVLKRFRLEAPTFTRHRVRNDS
jgi:hypothetical protein